MKTKLMMLSVLILLHPLLNPHRPLLYCPQRPPSPSPPTPHRPRSPSPGQTTPKEMEVVKDWLRMYKKECKSIYFRSDGNNNCLKMYVE